MNIAPSTIIPAGSRDPATRDRRIDSPGALTACWGLLVGRVAALVFGLGGLLIALPNPELWAGSELGLKTFDFGMKYGGS